jgi:integrase
MSGHAFRDDGVFCILVYEVRDRKRDQERVRWRMQSYYKGNRAGSETRSHFAKVEDAEKCAALMWQDYLQGLHAAPDKRPATVQELIDRFCAREMSKKGKLLSTASTLHSYPSQLQALVRVAGADLPVEHLAKKHVEAMVRLVNARTGKPLSRMTIDSYLRATSALVQWALVEGFLSADITAKVRFDAGPVVMRPWLQPREVEPFLASCSPSHRIRAGLLIETGLRAGEAVHLHWSWVQQGIGRPSIRVPALDPATGFRAKGKQARAIPLSLRGQACLAEAAERWGRAGFVLHASDKPIDSGNWCDDTHNACKKAGVTNIDTHGLRRTAGALWLASGIDIYRVSRLLGHASVTTTERAYAGLADGHLAAAMDAVDERAALPTLVGIRKNKAQPAPVAGPSAAVVKGSAALEGIV